MERLGLARFFDLMLDSHWRASRSPTRGCSRSRSSARAAAPETTLHVGDFYWIDVRGARAAGVQPVLLDPPGSTSRPIARA